METCGFIVSVYIFLVIQELTLRVSNGSFTKQPSRGVLKKSVLEISSKFTGEHPCRSVISVKLQSKFIEITPRHGCFLVKFAVYFRNTFLKEHLWMATSEFRYFQLLWPFFFFSFLTLFTPNLFPWNITSLKNLTNFTNLLTLFISD